jgi:hypothetical protein
MFHLPSFCRSLKGSIVVATIGLLGVGAGCEDSNSKKLSNFQASQSISKERRDSIRDALRYLPQLIRLDRTEALREIQYQLNTWSQSVSDKGTWKAPDMFETVSAQLRTTDFAKRLDRLEFGEAECEYLLQCQMMKDVALWVLDRPYKDPLFTSWLTSKKSSLDTEQGKQLEDTLKLFDWTVCNVAIEGQPKDVESLVSYGELPLKDNAPVYRQLPWQTMMFARGDSWQRARVFTQLLFTQGIPSFALALPSQSGAVENASLRMWCIGVPIANEIFLFEPQWGLPIPSQKGEGIATLAEARENPTALRRAKVPGFFEYPVEQKDLSDLIALLDVEPFAMGQSMQLLEKSLAGSNRMRISVDVDALAERLKKIDPKLTARLWNAPWLSHAYNLSIRVRLDEQSPFSMNYISNFGAFITETPISRARNLHLAGKFDSNVDAAGALRSYMDVRVDEKTLKEMETNKDIQAMLGVVRRPGQPLELFQAQIAQAQTFYRRSKFDVAAFLAMASFDNGKTETAVDWLSNRLLKVQGTDKWHAQSHYLLGRAYELQGKTTEAIEEYKFENTPQAAGNRIRIRKLSPN